MSEEPVCKKQKIHAITCTMVSGGMLKRVMDVLKDMVQEVLFEVSPEGLQTMCFDTSRVAFIHLLLPATSFLHYECPDPCLIGVKRAELVRALQCIPDSQSVTLFHVPGNSKMFVRSEENGKSREFDVQTIIVELPDITVSMNPVHDASCCLESIAFRNVCEKLHSFGEVVTISISRTSCEFSTPSGIVMKENKPGVVNEKFEKASNVFSLKYLNLFAKAHTICPNVQLGFSFKEPIYVVYTMEGGGYLMFVLAPKLQL